MKNWRWYSGDGHCWECGEPFPTKGLQEDADAHEKEHPHFRRSFSSCPRGHNYGEVAIFERDCEF